MTDEAVLTELLQREGGYRAEAERPNGTVDPETMYGITWPTYQRYGRRYAPPGSPAPTRAEFLAMHQDYARRIYTQLYILDPGFTREAIPYEPLRVQLIDFGVNSGPERAIRWLQRVLGLPEASVDGVLGPKTRERISLIIGDWQGFDDIRGRLVNDALVAARSYMIDRAVDAGSMRRQDEEGVESRALSFLVSRP